MVVIDAEKHKLDYKQSEIDNNIASLHKEYQGRSTGGAATIISRAKSQAHVPKRQGAAKINIKGKPWYDPTKPEGSYIYQTAKDANYDVTKVNKRTGEVTTVTKTRMIKSTKMAEATDAYDLISPSRHPMEIIYADYANSMKDLANRARVEMTGTGKIAYSPSAKNIYSAEVKSLNEKLRNAELNRTREREAQRMANVEVQTKVASGQIDKKDTKKAGQQALTRYRTEVGATTRKDRNIIIEDKEWEAIQAGAIHENTLKRILNNTDIDVLRERATPRSTTTLSNAQINRIKKLSASDYTLAEIAQKMGKSPSTISKYLKGVN
jgi:DNA-binding CsgD family transcriptional regulator